MKTRPIFASVFVPIRRHGEEPLGQKLSALAPRAEKCEKTYALRKRKLRPKAVCNRTPCMTKSMMTR